tara:strand:+ start:382 stop:753 length:372 start_codon:yes stop_codon:yes gene_type:complete
MKKSTDLFIYKTSNNLELIEDVKKIVKTLENFGIKNITIDDNEEIYWVDFPDNMKEQTSPFAFDYSALKTHLNTHNNLEWDYVDDSNQVNSKWLTSRQRNLRNAREATRRINIDDSNGGGGSW